MKSFLIPSLLAAGFNGSSEYLSDEKNTSNYFEGDGHKFWNLMDRKLSITLAGHSSHASHGSHGSHGSHRSSAGGGYVPTPSPAPVPKVYKPVPNNPTTPESVLPKVPGTSAQFKRIAMRVQMYLYAFGFYNGAIDGVVNTDTKVGIMKFQEDRGLSITGKIDDALLKAMNVSTE